MPNLKYKNNNTPRFLKPFYQLPGVLKLLYKRQRHYFGLSLLALINIILAVGLVTNASFFSEAVDRVVLLQELGSFSSVTGRPPFSTSIYIFPSRRAPMTLENAEQISQHIRETVSGEVGLPVRHLGTQVSSGSLMLQPAEDSEQYTQGQSQGREYLGNAELVYIHNVTDKMRIIEGQPLDADGVSQSDLDVWMHNTTAQAMGINVGEKLRMGLTLADARLTVRIAGIWNSEDPNDEFWFNNPDTAFKSALLVRRADYVRSVQPIIASGSGESAWYVILDETKIIPKQSASYLAGFRRSLDLINRFLPGARMNTPPLDPLEKFVQRSSALTILLIGYNLPAFGILLYFLALTATIISQWQRRETVMLVSRGMSAGGILALTMVEQLSLFAVGYPLGVMFGMFIAWVMGFTASFLSFTSRASLPVSLEGLSLPLTLVALAFALISRLWPAVRAARSSLVTEERERARPMRKPFWYRYYLDLLLLIPTVYAYDQMSKRGSLAGLVTDRPEDLYRDPLLIVVPALFILTVSLVTMRVFAMFMRLVDLVAGKVPWLTLHLALRQLGRQSLDYVQPLLLVIISLAMGVYTLSMAASLDQWSVDRMFYRNGADIAFTPSPSNEPVAVIDGSWIPLPGDFQNFDGVQAATRVGEFSMRINPNSAKEVRGRFLAIDRAEFPNVAWFRPDFANEPLGAMMNRLAFAQEGVLVSQRFLEENGLNINDPIPVVISVENLMSVYSDYIIVGTYNYFPTVYDESTTIIGNLDYISTQIGLTAPHDIWLNLDSGVEGRPLVQNIAASYGMSAGRIRDTSALITEEHGRMERVGIFGTLSVGFLATALMAILGLLVYSYASLQERAYRLAVLNAVGLSRNQIMTQVVLEYAFLAMFGVVAGTLIGLFASELFVPFFRYTGERGIPLPPLIPIIASEQLRNLSLIFGGTIVAVEVATIASLLHQRLVQILKRVWI
jgi:putative ABC transport system permease protein